MNEPSLHHLLDFGFGERGEQVLRERLEAGDNIHAVDPKTGETLVHVAARRFRPGALRVLIEHRANINAKNANGKTAYAHACRRGFAPIATLLRDEGATTHLNPADEFAIAVIEGRLDDARVMLLEAPEVAQTGNPGEDRLLADVAGRADPAPVEFLIQAGADLSVRGLDDGTPLHQAAWFGQPQNARLLVAAGALLEIFDRVHSSSPIGWAVHGSSYSGGAEEREDLYVEVTQLLLEAGSCLFYPEEPTSDAYFQRMLKDASPKVEALLRRHSPGNQ
jgi:ankyrin repeat protein